MKSLLVIAAAGCLAVASAQEQIYADPAAGAVPGAADYYSGELIDQSKFEIAKIAIC